MSYDLFKLESLSIELDKPDCSYFAGDTVKGHVEVEVSEVIPEDADDHNVKRTLNPIGYMMVRAKGKAKTYWHTGVEETRRKFGKTEKYIDTYLPLYRKGQEKVEVRLQPGKRKYLFRFTLPWDLPSSYEAKKGSVGYYVKVYVKNVDKEDMKEKRHFTVTGISDLNDTLLPIQQATLQKEKYLSCFCCKSGPIRFELRIPRTHYVPEEFITFDVEFTNLSNRVLHEPAVNILQKTVFKANEKLPRKTKWFYKTTEKVLEFMHGPQLRPGDVETFESCQIKIPKVPPTKLAGCNLIDVDYFLQVYMKIPYAFPLEGKIPLFIGTIPLTSEKLAALEEAYNYGDNCDSTVLDTEETTEQCNGAAGNMNFEGGKACGSSVAATSQQDDEDYLVSLEDEETLTNNNCFGSGSNNNHGSSTIGSELNHHAASASSIVQSKNSSSSAPLVTIHASNVVEETLPALSDM